MNPALTLLLAALLSQTPAAADPSSTETPRCDFTDRKPLRISHALLKSVLHRVQPDYPSMARATGTTGDVKVLILVNRDGDVVDACTLTGHPLLREAARIAATQWKFEKNFGLGAKQRHDFIEATITFRFRAGKGWTPGRVGSNAPPN